MTIDLTQIAVAIIAVLGAVITGFIIPWLKSKIGVNNDKLTDNQRMLLELAIKTAVTAAEQLYKSDEGQKKKAYVLAILESQGFAIDSSAVDAAIESMVYECHHAYHKQETVSQ